MSLEKAAEVIDSDELNYMAEVLKLVADRNRLLILSLLQHSDMCVCELVQIIQMSQPAVSGNLRKLKSYGLVKETKKKNWVFYSLKIDDKPYVEELLKYVPDVKPLLEDFEKKGLRVSCD